MVTKKMGDRTSFQTTETELPPKIFQKTTPQRRIYWHCGVFCLAFISLADSNNSKYNYS